MADPDRSREPQQWKLRLSTPCYLSKADIDNFVDKFDACRKMKGIA